MIHGRIGAFALLTLVIVGLGSDDPSGRVPIPGRQDRTVGAQKRSPIQRVDGPGIENLFRLGPGLYSGAQPEGRQGFETLKRLGVRTILSVDGAQPDVEQARRLGLRYIHLPIGYDGIGHEQVVRLVKAVRSLPGPLFVHCHHGKHRGPAAAAICARATEDWDKGQARAWLEQAGTDPKYQGLYATVDQFVPPSNQELKEVRPDDLPEHAEVPGLVEAMVGIDESWDTLNAAQKAGFPSPSSSPDRPEQDPAHEATLLAEHFREAARLEESKSKGDEFTRRISAASRDAAHLETVIPKLQAAASAANRQEVENTLARMRRQCAECHARFRDQRGR